MNSEKFHYIEYANLSDSGFARENNEDAFASLPVDGCFLVSDGMGGGSAGELASQIVEESISGSISGSAQDSPGIRKYTIQQAIHEANRKIQDYSNSRHFQQMGATLALLLFDSWQPDKAMLCHVGDSRIYLFRDEKLALLTCDHTLGGELSKKNLNKIFENHKSNVLSHVLTRSIGISNNVMPEWQQIKILPQDIFLICSDGVSTMLSNNEMQEIFAVTSDLSELLAGLSCKIQQAGAKDNYTMILCKIALAIPIGETHSQKELEENSYLLKISEERIDYA